MTLNSSGVPRPGVVAIRYGPRAIFLSDYMHRDEFFRSRAVNINIRWTNWFNLVDCVTVKELVEVDIRRRKGFFDSSVVNGPIAGIGHSLVYNSHSLRIQSWWLKKLFISEKYGKTYVSVELFCCFKIHRSWWAVVDDALSTFAKKRYRGISGTSVLFAKHESLFGRCICFRRSFCIVEVLGCRSNW